MIQHSQLYTIPSPSRNSAYRSCLLHPRPLLARSLCRNALNTRRATCLPAIPRSSQLRTCDENPATLLFSYCVALLAGRTSSANSGSCKAKEKIFARKQADSVRLCAVCQIHKLCSLTS